MKTCKKCGESIPVGLGCIHICFEVAEVGVIQSSVVSLTPIGPREANLDGTRHIEGGSCCTYARCRCCGSGRLHMQGIVTGVMTICESCRLPHEDTPEWHSGGTFAHLEVC